MADTGFMKKIIAGVVILLVVLALVVAGAALFLDSAVKKGVETFGPKVAKVEVKLDSVRISLLSGNGALKGLLVGNPPGFDSPSAIKAGEISLEVQPGSVLSDKIVVRSVRVLGPEVTMHGLKGDNLKKIVENIQASTGGGATAPKEPAKSDAPTKKIQVDDLLIKDGKVALVLPLVGNATVALPEIHLTGLGQGTNGITAAELSDLVLKRIMEAAMQVAAGAGKDPGKALESVTKGGGAQLEKTVKGIGNLLKK